MREDSTQTALSLALANTARGLPASAGRDLLGSPAGLRSWLEAQADALGDPGDDVALRVLEFRVLREAIGRVLEALVAGGALPLEAVQRINEASASVPRWPEIDSTDPSSPVPREAGAAVGRTVEILAAIARSAVALVASGNRERIQRCPAPRCGRFFVATRRGTVWCGPSCGNRVRVARHHGRATASSRSRSRPA